MNRILKFTAILAAVIGLALASTSCRKDFLNPPMWGSIDEQTALRTPRDVRNALVGTYQRLAGAAFYGRNAHAVIDFLGDMAGLDLTNSGHLRQFVEYTITEADGGVLDIWSRGYMTIDMAARVITNGKRILANTTADGDVKNINMDLAQAYGIKALVHFYMVNFWGLPYNLEPNSLGLVVVGDNPIPIGTEVSRSTVRQTYAQILDDIASAKTHFAAGAGGGTYPSSVHQYWMNEAAVYALEARVHLYMGTNMNAAITAAQEGLTKSGARVVDTVTVYKPMWGQSTPTPEDIFTIHFTSATQLSANSMPTLWAAYRAVVYPKYVSLFDTADYRLSLLGDKTITGNHFLLKYPNTNAVNNNSIFRASEMHLIIAEAQARNNNLPAARTALLNVAKRNPNITGVDHLPQNQAELLAFIADERARELTGEGHRWFDLRRTGALLNRTSDLKNIADFDVKNNVMPIPQQERNASKIEQNPNWAQNMPR